MPFINTSVLYLTNLSSTGYLIMGVSLIIFGLLVTGWVYKKSAKKTKLEGFHDAVDAVQEVAEPPSIGRVFTIIRRMSGILLSSSFFSDAIRQSGMSVTELARDYIQKEKALASQTANVVQESVS